MLARLHHTSSRLLAPARLHNVTRLKFSSSAVVAARAASGRSARRDDDEEDAPAGRSFKAAMQAQLAEGNEGDDAWKSSRKDAGDEAEEGSNSRGSKGSSSPFLEFKQQIAPEYFHAQRHKWLGVDRPFPLNPTFRPPPPVSDDLRARIYRAHTVNPEVNSVRVLAARYHLSMKRVEAILRLKAMEQTWKQTHELQTGFQYGMEQLLGVQVRYEKLEDNALEAREADMQADLESPTHRYQRLFWETVEEGTEPVMPGILEAARGDSASNRTKRETTFVERAPGRPALKFIDVGDAFVDPKEKARREREGARRSAVKARGRHKKHLQLMSA